MIELKGLEDWARGILEVPTPALNRCYGSWKKEDELRKSIENLPFFSRYRPVFRSILAPTLRELHQKLRGHKCEEVIWTVILESLDHALPDEIALDLIERYSPNRRVILMLGHSRQNDAVMWKLAPLVDEALLTLAKSFYTESNRTLEELEKALRWFPTHEWMLESLGHCSASSLEKRLAYEKAIEEHPQRERWFSINQRIEPRVRRSSYFDLSGLSETERLKTLYGGYSFDQLLEIGRDDATPDEILHELENLPGSREVRFVARHTLRRREESSPSSQ